MKNLNLLFIILNIFIVDNGTANEETGGGAPLTYGKCTEIGKGLAPINPDEKKI